MQVNSGNKAEHLHKDSTFWSRHQVFLREARQVAHQSLYYLCLIDHYPESKKHRPIFEQYAAFAYDQVRAMLNGVHLQSAYWDRDERLSGTASTEYQQAFSQVDQWQQEIRDTLNKEKTLVAADAQRLISAFEQFLDVTAPQGWWQKFWGHTLYNFLRYLKKHFSLLVSMLLALGIIALVPAVRNLIIDIGWPALLMLLFFPVYTWLFHRFSRPLFPFGKMAQASFRKYRYQSLEPSHGLRRFPHDGIVENKVFAQVTLMAALQLFILSVLISVTYLFWGYLSSLLWSTSLSVFIILSIMYSLIVLANLIDVSDFFHLRPIRLLALAAAALLLIISFLSEYSAWMSFAAFASIAAGLLIPFFRDRRRTSLLFFGLIFVTMATSLVLHSLTRSSERWRDQPGASAVRLSPDDWPHSAGDKPPPVVLIAASGGGSRSAIYTALTLRWLNKEMPQIAQQIQVISSVSGGSLANAAYISRKLQYALNSSGKTQPEFMASLNGMKTAVSDDFILPTLIGAFIPFDSRGRRIERYWEEGPVDLSTTHISDLAKTWQRSVQQDSVPPFPIPMFNSTSLDGHRVVISPFDKQMYTNPRINREASGENNAYRQGDSRHTWVYYRDGIYGLEDLLPVFDPRLSASVRASANFPFGFPLIEIETNNGLFYNPDPEIRQSGTRKTVSLTDGGALSNSGMWSLTDLMLNNIDRLKERGVLLIVIEASIMPEYSGVDKRLTSLAGVIIDQSPIGQNLHRRIFNLLDSHFGDRLGIVQIDLIPTVDYQVMTTWALDRRSIDRLQKSFVQRWQMESKNIKNLWNQLRAGGALDYSISRPPLD